MELYPLSGVQLIVTKSLLKLASLKTILYFYLLGFFSYCSLFITVIDCMHALTLDFKFYKLRDKSTAIILLSHSSGTRVKLLLFS